TIFVIGVIPLIVRRFISFKINDEPIGLSCIKLSRSQLRTYCLKEALSNLSGL
ncbi:hypothetical protein L9F63_015994, partial [Diploptera punctata]